MKAGNTTPPCNPRIDGTWACLLLLWFVRTCLPGRRALHLKVRCISSSETRDASCFVVCRSFAGPRPAILKEGRVLQSLAE